MGKSPKELNEEGVNNESKQEGKMEQESEPFKFGNEARELDPSTSDFSNDLPTPFDNFVGHEEGNKVVSNNSGNGTGNNNSSKLELPEASVPATSLGLGSSTLSNNSSVKKSPQKVNRPMLNNKTASAASVKKQAQNGNAPKQQSDPEKLSDALLSAGVDVKEEEALLNSTVVNMKSNSHVSNSQIPPHPPFLHPSHVAAMMKRVAAEQNFNQEFSKSSELLSLMSTACELYIRDIITNSIVISRHRRKAVKLNSGRRSEVTRVLRELALQQREQEERRVKRRVALGLEKENLDAKLDSGETQHRASNATANMMIAGGKKKYSWLTSASKSNNADLKNSSKVSSAVAARGDLGIKYREAREEPGIVMRDLLHALENRRVGVSNTIAKGYARIRD